ncbi:hypothetical protein GCM10027084_20380 [Pseudoxanthomonas sangjuensis]|uniref:hypothetical protein n=1 Tax=Pseudoxanthomonas sangjuensis TaxID=1503750 RepID=UPI001391B6F3|nr:hypothetical protein [Pseudoxanthomonas sangjuensis]
MSGLTSPHRLLPLSFCLLLAASPVLARQDDAPPLRIENVRLDYAQVLNVEPVYATQRARRSEKVCDEAPRQAKSAGKPVELPKEEGRWSRMWGSVKGWFADDKAQAANPEPERKPNCRTVTQQDAQAPIAYDVDYMYKGMKYRARLPEDPGNRLRIRISVTPYLPGSDTVP